jgi:hypothetical protein
MGLRALCKSTPHICGTGWHEKRLISLYGSVIGSRMADHEA